MEHMELLIWLKYIAGLSKRQDKSVCYLKKTHLTNKDKHRLKVQGFKKKLCTNENPRIEVDFLVSEKNVFQKQLLKEIRRFIR